MLPSQPRIEISDGSGSRATSSGTISCTEIFGGGSYPQMLLRVGWAPINADPLPSTPRRELSDFVEWMADSE